MNAPARPTKDAAFFAALAEDSDWMLVAAAMIAATRRDFDALNGLVDFLMTPGEHNQVLIKNPVYRTSVPQHTDRNPSPMVEREDSSLTMAFATAFSVEDKNASLTRSPAPALALAQRVAELYNAPLCSNFALLAQLDRLLHDASSRVADPGILKIILHAGACPNQKSASHRFQVTGKTYPLSEAIACEHWEAAQQIASSMEGSTLNTFVLDWLSPIVKSDSTPARKFAVSSETQKMVSGLRQDPILVKNLLETFESGIEPSIPTGSVSPMPMLRMRLAAAFLLDTVKKLRSNATEEQMEILLGRPGDATHSRVKTYLDSFAHKHAEKFGVGGFPPNPWKLHHVLEEGCQYQEVETDFLYQALRTHCVPAISISQEVLVAAAASEGPGPQQAIDGKIPDLRSSEESSQFSFSPDNFRSTLDLLQKAGWHLNALPEGNNALHVLAASDGPHLFEMLPILLDLGVEEDAGDAFQAIPVERIQGINPSDDASMVERWNAIVKSHAARKTALRLIDEMDLQDNEPKPSAP